MTASRNLKKLKIRLFAMTNNQFDQKLKSTLDNLEVPFDASSWGLLEQRLNAPFAEEQPAPVDAVDKAVFRTLERLDAPYQPAHWDLLAGRMTLADRARRRVWMFKLSEAAIFLLLIANLQGYLGPSIGLPAEPVKQQKPAIQRLQAEAPAFKNRRGNTTATEMASLENGADISADWISGSAPSDKAGNPTLDGTLVSNLFEPGTSGTSESTLVGIVPAEWTALADLMIVPVLEPAESVERVNANPYAASTVKVKAPKQHRMYAATFVGLDQNYVRADGYSTHAAGYGAGVAIGYRIGQWGMEAGLSYNRRQYQPKKEIEIYDGNTVNGFYGSYASNVDADVLSVPVKVTRRFARFGQTTAHATAGVTAHVALDKSYQYRSVYYPGQAPGGNLNPGQDPKLKQNAQGALENGSLRGNVYASADLGVRIEQPIGRHIAAFVEPAYRLALGGKGFGPNPGKINTFSVQAGVLATL